MQYFCSEGIKERCVYMVCKREVCTCVQEGYVKVSKNGSAKKVANGMYLKCRRKRPID